MRKKIVTIIGSTNCTSRTKQLSLELGRSIAENHWRVATGGYGGVMEFALKGMRSSDKYVEGSTIAVVPTYSKKNVNKFADIVIPTGVGLSRNVILVSIGDIIVAMQGGAGTLSEIALAYQLHKTVIVMHETGGWAGKLKSCLKSSYLDLRNNSPIYFAGSTAEVIKIIKNDKTVDYEPSW